MFCAGIAIDLVDPSLYEAQPGASLHPDDAALLAAAGSGGGASAAQRVKSIRQEVTWLRKTPLMGNNLYEAVGYGKHAGQQIERKVAERRARWPSLSPSLPTSPPSLARWPRARGASRARSP